MECHRACRWTPRRAARSASSSMRRRTLRGSSGVPISVVTTRPCPCQPPADAPCSSSCRVRWARSASTAELRMLTRYRVQLMGDRTREATRFERMLEDASIKLSAVASSLTTGSARAMLTALIDGDRDRRSWPIWPRARCAPTSPGARARHAPFRHALRGLWPLAPPPETGARVAVVPEGVTVPGPLVRRAFPPRSATSPTPSSSRGVEQP